MRKTRCWRARAGGCVTLRYTLARLSGVNIPHAGTLNNSLRTFGLFRYGARAMGGVSALCFLAFYFMVFSIHLIRRRRTYSPSALPFGAILPAAWLFFSHYLYVNDTNSPASAL